jgi:putative acyl-CoA dehydrogenase
LALDYSSKRKAFGKKIVEHPLQQIVLAEMAQTVQAGLLFTFSLVELLGKEETGKASAEEKQLLRLLTPILKLYTAKKCMQQTSEMVETFGGAGYVEDTGIPKWLRDAQVYSIWEGTTNVLSLDMLRALEKESSLQVLWDYLHKDLEAAKQKSHLKNAAEKIQNAMFAESAWLEKNSEQLPQLARNLAFWLGDIYCASKFLAFAAGSSWDGASKAALYFIENRDFKLLPANATKAKEILY